MLLSERIRGDRMIIKLRNWILTILCRHDYSEMVSTYYRDNNNKGIVITPYVCEKCGKYKEIRRSVR